jgi:hypothetical protein
MKTGNETTQVENLHQEIAALRKEVRDLLRQQRPDQSGPQP